MRLGDVADVTDGPEDARTTGLFNGKPAVVAIISRQPGANIIAAVEAVKAQLPGLQAGLPGDITMSVAADRTTTIRASLRDVEVTLVDRDDPRRHRRQHLPAVVAGDGRSRRRRRRLARSARSG